ncbi:MAG: homoserine kinase [Acidobacteriota bacterium]|nr:homoserine kinase [Blastocatellia bacterium]MDW8411619.1 homoserine kinase [Acidobacteriota bacterium]
MFKIRVPASTANLGPGFDCFGLALSLYIELTAKPSSRWELELQGEGAERLPSDETNLIVRVAQTTAASCNIALPPMQLLINNSIPPARGLGSSAAAITAGIALVEAARQKEFSLQEFFKHARKFEPHVDNLSAARLGGFTVCCINDSYKVFVARHEWPTTIKAVVAIPEYELNTKRSRSVLANRYSRSDAVFNLQHAALLQSGILTNRPDLISVAMKDRLHQPYRAELVPGLTEALELRLPGLIATALSGSGPTVVAFITENELAISSSLKELFASKGIVSQTQTLSIDTEGRKIDEI